MAAIVAKNGKIRFTANNDTHTPIASLEIISASVSATTAGTFRVTRTNGGDVLLDVIMPDLTTQDFYIGGCVPTDGGLTFTTTGAGSCILYVK